MTNFTTKIMMAAATLVVAAGAASAQTLKAEIPFTFRAGGKMMAAGTYEVADIGRVGNIPVFRLREAHQHDSVMAAPVSSGEAKKSWMASGGPVMAFECGAGPCALVGIWGGRYSLMYRFHAPNLGKDAPTRMAVIAMRPAGSD